MSKLSDKLVELSQNNEEQFIAEVERLSEIEDAPAIAIVEYIEHIREAIEKLITVIQSQPEPKEVEFSSVETEIRSLQDTIRESVASINPVNLSPIVTKLTDILSKIDQIEAPDLISVESLLSQILTSLKRDSEEIDYTPQLDGIKKTLESLNVKEKEDYSPFLAELEKIIKKNLRIEVSGGGTSSVSNRLGSQINPATQEGQEQIVTAIQNISIPAPTGGATEAKQDTLIGHVDGIEGILTTIEGNQLPDGHNVTIANITPIPVSGTVTVDTLPSIPAGTNNIGDVDVLTLPLEVRTATAVDASASGDTTIVAITNTPRLYYISLSANGGNSADVTAIVKIGASTKYKVSLKAGAIWARNVGAGRAYISGSAGDDIVVNLSAAQTVHVSVEYADV
jgi:hypothetical protein